MWDRSGEGNTDVIIGISHTLMSAIFEMSHIAV